MEDEKKIVVVGAGGGMIIMDTIAELTKMAAKYEQMPASFGPAHTIAYDQSRIEELRKKFETVAGPPPQDLNQMRQFVRHHSRRRR